MRIRNWIAVLALTGLAACGGGGGGGGGSGTPAPAAAVIDSANAATISREVIDKGIGASAFGVAARDGGILASDGGSGTLSLSGRRNILGAHPSETIPPETFDCNVSGTVRESGSIQTFDNLSVGDRYNADFTNCDDDLDFILDGGLDLVVNSFSGDFLSDLYLLGARLTLTSFTTTTLDPSEQFEQTVTADGIVDLDLDLTAADRSELTVSGAELDLTGDGDAWALQDFALTIVEDSAGTGYSGTGTLDGSGFEGVVDFVTILPLQVVFQDYPESGEVLITGANNTSIRVIVIDATSLQLDIDLNGDGSVDETQQLGWTMVNDFLVGLKFQVNE